MGIHTLTNDKIAVMYCSTTDWAFGPVICEDDKHSAEERLEAFIEWLPQDARTYSDPELESKYSEWLRQEEAQWKAKEQDINELLGYD